MYVDDWSCFAALPRDGASLQVDSKVGVDTCVHTLIHLLAAPKRVSSTNVADFWTSFAAFKEAWSGCNLH